MKKYKKLYLSLAISILAIINPFRGWGQISNVNTLTGKPIMLEKGYDGVQGSPYFTSDWRGGAIVYDGKHIENVQVKYEAYEDHAEVLYNGKPIVPDEKLVSSFEFTQSDESGVAKKYLFKNGYEGDGISKRNYLNVVYEGSNVVLAEQIKIVQTTVSPATYGGRPIKEFSLSKNYVLVQKGVAQQFKPSKKNFINQFPVLEDRLKNYFKENKVDFNNHEDLAKLVAFIVSIDSN